MLYEIIQKPNRNVNRSVSETNISYILLHPKLRYPNVMMLYMTVIRFQFKKNVKIERLIELVFVETLRIFPTLTSKV